MRDLARDAMLPQHLSHHISKSTGAWQRAARFFGRMLHPLELGLNRLRNWADRGAGLEEPSLRLSPREFRGGQPFLIHYHIFKNAGTSFEWALQQVLDRRYRSFDSSTPRGLVAHQDIVAFSAENPEVVAISSHQAAPPAPEIAGRSVLTSILIRDPIARIRSIYVFEREQEAPTPGSLKAKEFSFRDYVEWRLKTSPSMLCNYQVHFCTRTAERPAPTPDEERLKLAIAHLDQMDIVGTVARYNEWIALAENILASAFSGLTLPSAHRNATNRAALPETAIFDQLVNELGEGTAHRLVENNQLDMCLYQVADALLTRRLAERRVSLKLLEAYTDARKSQS